jgi:hypothetical protein
MTSRWQPEPTVLESRYIPFCWDGFIRSGLCWISASSNVLIIIVLLVAFTTHMHHLDVNSLVDWNPQPKQRRALKSGDDRSRYDSARGARRMEQVYMVYIEGCKGRKSQGIASSSPAVCDSPRIINSQASIRLPSLCQHIHLCRNQIRRSPADQQTNDHGSRKQTHLAFFPDHLAFISSMVKPAPSGATR